MWNSTVLSGCHASEPAGPRIGEGRWVWTEPWGWTWVDDQPWGFAPSHYGRWVNMAGVVGLVSRNTRGAGDLRARARCFHRRPRRVRPLVPRFGRVVPAWSGRCLRAVLPGQPELRAGYQRHQRPRHECGRASPLCEPGRARCGDRGGTGGIRERTTGDRGGSRVAGRRVSNRPGLSARRHRSLQRRRASSFGRVDEWTCLLRQSCNGGSWRRLRRRRPPCRLPHASRQ